VRIDRSDQTDGSDSAELARGARSAPDEPDVAGNDGGKEVGGDGLPDSSPARLDPVLRIERTAVYRAAVDAAYQQHYAVDRSYARVEKLESGTAAPVTHSFEAEDPEPHPADQGPTGARGSASGREFDPEAAGGPILQLDSGTERITSEGVQEVGAHLQRFKGGGPLDAPEQAMLDRLTSIAAGDMEPTSYDLNFYTHELDEAGRYAQLGFGHESGADLGSPKMYDVWNDVHTAALEDYGISGADLFYPGLGP
jgi:hypothetical protein